MRYAVAMSEGSVTPSSSARFVRDRMSSPVATVDASAALADVVSAVEARGVSALAVTDADRLVGLVSTTDLVAALARAEAAGSDGPEVRARDVMSYPVATTGADRPLVEAARAMVTSRIHRLVVKGGEGATAGVPRGILAARDLLDEVKATGKRTPISELMTAEVRTLDVGDPVSRAVAELADAKVHGLVVVENGRPVGVFTHAEALAARKLPPMLRSRPVEEVMSYETICLDATTSVARAAGYAAAMNVRRILVVAERQLVGVVSALDLVRALV